MSTGRAKSTGSFDDRKMEENALVMKLVNELLTGRIVDIRPQLDFTTELGFAYPAVEKVLAVKGAAVIPVLEYLADKGILKKAFFDRLLRCPQCQSLNLSPSTNCPKCGSANIARGRVFEHFVCKYVGLEDDFLTGGKYICPHCAVELRTLGVDYQSLGVSRKCRECGEIFSMPAMKWRCLKCSSSVAEDRVQETNLFSYSLDEEKRSWLEFELKPKSQLVEFLKQRGYRVVENATLKGRSGAEHSIDLLATRDDGVVTHNIAIGVEVAGEKIGLEKIFGFDDKVYDIGIQDKIMIVLPALENEAERFASQQKIKVLEVRDLETVLSSGIPALGGAPEKESFEFKSKSQLTEFLKHRGYEVNENAVMRGRSGAEHTIDMLATRDDGIIIHHIAIGFGVAKDSIGLERLFDFDDKTYDIGIRSKAFIAIPGLTKEARQFAQRQHITVFEVPEIEPAS